jgi:hypothetical protein
MRTGFSREARQDRQENQKLIHLGMVAILWCALARLCDSTTGVMGKTAAKRDPRVLVLDEVLRALRAELPNLEQGYGIRSLGVFGSIVRDGQAAVERDVHID